MRVVEIKTQDQQRRYVVIDDAGMLVQPILPNTIGCDAFTQKQYHAYQTIP